MNLYVKTIADGEAKAAISTPLRLIRRVGKGWGLGAVPGFCCVDFARRVVAVAPDVVDVWQWWT